MYIYLSGYFIYTILENISMIEYSIFINHLVSYSHKYNLILNVPFCYTFWIIFPWEFQTFYISKGVNFLHFRSFIYFICSSYLSQRVPSHCCSSFTWLKPIVYPRNKSASPTKTRIILDWTIWNYYFYRSKCQMSAISYGLS